MRTNRTISCTIGMVMWFMLLGSGLAPAVEAPVRILPLGDSITYGEGEPGSQGGYRNLLYYLLSTAGYNVDFIGTLKDSFNPGLPDKNHEGHQAYRVDQLDADVGGWLDKIEDPDVILLLIGTNDFLQTWRNETPAGVLAELDSLITNLATKRPFAKIIVSTLILSAVNPDIEAKQVTFNHGIPRLVAQYVAEGRQVSMVDMHPVLNAGDLYDTVHPTDAGFDKMANAWQPAITGVIAPQGTSNPPVIARAASAHDRAEISVTFSKPVANDSVSLSDFLLSDGLTVSNAVLDNATKRTITLTTSPQTPGLVHTLTVSGVKDRTPQQTPIAPQSMANVYPNMLDNGSFEENYTGWNATGNQATASSWPYIASNGNKLVAFNGGQASPNGVLSQSFTTIPGRIYQLTFDMGILSYNTKQQRLRVTAQGTNYLIFDTNYHNGSGGGSIVWWPKTYYFTANSPTTNLTFTDTSTTTDSIDLLLDNVRVSTVVWRALAVASSPFSGVNMTICPADSGDDDNGPTSLIRCYDDGASVTVNAPATFAGKNFLKWRKNGVDQPGSNPSIPLTMGTNHSLDAIYEPNIPPVAIAQSKSLDEDATAAITLTGNDPDGGTLAFTIDQPPSHGVLSGTAPNLIYTPDPNYNGPDDFTFIVNDGIADSATAIVSITVNSINDAPVALADEYIVDEDTPLIVIPSGILDNDVDDDPAPLTAELVTDVTHGNLSLSSDGGFSYTPSADFHGGDSFTYRSNDGFMESNVVTVTITVTEVGGNPLTEWLASHGLVASPGDDSDLDPISNAVEYVIGGNPKDQMDASLLPSATRVVADPDGDTINAGYLRFTYRRTDRAKNDALTTIQVEWSGDLAGPWLAADGTHDEVVVVEDDQAGPATDWVHVYIPLSSMEKIFARLKVLAEEE